MQALSSPPVTALPVNVDLTAYRGDSWEQAFVLKSGDTPVDLTGATVAAWAALNGGSPFVLEVTVGPDPGMVTLSQAPGVAGAYRYDLEVTDAADAVTTWIRGRLVVEQDVTNRL